MPHVVLFSMYAFVINTFAPLHLIFTLKSEIAVILLWRFCEFDLHDLWENGLCVQCEQFERFLKGPYS